MKHTDKHVNDDYFTLAINLGNKQKWRLATQLREYPVESFVWEGAPPRAEEKLFLITLTGTDAKDKAKEI